MAAIIDLSSAASSMQTYLTDWEAGVPSGYGAFWNPTDGLVTQPDPAATYDQWGSGTAGGDGIVIDGTMQYSRGNLTGTVDTITLGSGYSASNANGVSVSDDLIITNDPSFDMSGYNDLFDQAMYQLISNGSASGLYAYLAAVGTEINDTAGDDSLVGFGGADTFVFSGGEDAISAGAGGMVGYQDGVDTLDVSAWGATSFSSLFVYQDQNDAVVEYGTDKIVIADTTATDLDASDFLFA